MKADASASAHQTSAPGKTYRVYVLVVLTAVYTFNFIDRQIIGILAPEIQKDLGVTDGQLGLLIGFAFAVLYTTLGIPIARLADRANRVTIISIALACWSGFTALSGFAQNFWQMAAARVGVGIGEAGGSPPAHSLISDFYSSDKRAGALAVYSLGIPIGITLAYLGGGWLLENFSWRAAFMVVGVPGVFLALLVRLTIREPKRGGMERAETTDAFKSMRAETPESPFERAAFLLLSVLPKNGRRAAFHEIAVLWRAAKHLLSIPSYRAIVIGLTAGSFSSYALGGWIVVFFSRAHAEMPMLEVLFWLGIINGTAYVAGVFAGGNLVDRLAKVKKSAYGLVPMVALLLGLPFLVSALWAPSPIWSLVIFWPVHFLSGIYLGPCFALAQTLAPLSIRALSTAIFFFIINFVALGFGPTYLGYASEILTNQFGQTPAGAIRIALTSLIIPGLISAASFVYLARTIGADWNKATGE